MSDREVESNGRSSSYYSVLGIHKDASTAEIRCAYRKLALKWHPDRCTRNPTAAEESNWRFQQIQEAYSVLSDNGKRSMYDTGLFDSFKDDDDDKDFSDFMEEMVSMMESVRRPQEEGDCLEELQKMFLDMTKDESFKFGGFESVASPDARNRTRVPYS